MASLGEVSVDVLFPDGEADSELTSSIVNAKDGTPVKLWVGTRAEYNNIVTEDENTLYVVDL